MAMASAAEALSWRRLGPILSVQFIGTLGYSIALPFLVFLVTDLGGAPWTYGVLGATYSVFQLLGAPLLGRMSDRVGRRNVLVLSQLGTMLAWLVFLGALQLPKQSLMTLSGAMITVPLLLIFAARAFDGLTGGNVAVANALVADLTRDSPDARQTAFGRMGVAASLGFSLGPAIAGVLTALVPGYSAPVAFAAFIALVATVLCARLQEPQRVRRPREDAPKSCLVEVFGQKQHADDPVFLHPRRRILFEPRVALLLVATFVQFVAYNLFYAGFPVHAERALGWDAASMGAFFSVLAVSMVIAEGPLLGFVSSRIAPMWVFATGASVLALSFLCLMTTSSPILYVGAVLYALGNGLAWPTFQAQLSSAAGDEAQGIVQGAATSAGSLASIVGLLAGAFLYSSLETSLFAMSAGIFVVVSLASPLWFRTRRMPEC